MCRQYFNTARTENKDLKPLLKIINKDIGLKHQLTHQLQSTCNMLGYDLNSEFIYTTVNRDKYVWQTTINNKYRTKEYNFDTKKYDYVEKEYNFHDLILKHCFPLELKNKKRQTNTHYVHENIWGSSLKQESDIIVFDIDCHKGNTLQSYQELMSLIDYFKEYIYLEKSYEGGFHLYIKLNAKYDMIAKRKLFENIKKEINLECTELPSRVRFPFSYHYEPCDKDFETFNPVDSMDIIKHNYDNQHGYIIKELKEDKKVIPIISAIYERTRQSKIKHITPDEFLNITDIVIYEGYRNEPMLQICRISNFNNWTREETLHVIRNLDNGSKDLSKWGDTKLLKVIETMKNKSTIYYQESISTKPETFISNIDYVPTVLKTNIENKQFIDNIITNCNYRITELNRYKFTIILKEMIGAILYDCKNNRITINDKNNKYIIGKQFSAQYAILMKKYYPEFSSTDVHGIIKSILKDSGLFTQYKSNIRGWSFNPNFKEGNFCKQYDFINNKKHILFKDINIVLYIIIMLFKSLNKTNNIKLLIIQDFFNSIISNIQLNYGENYPLLEYG